MSDWIEWKGGECPVSDRARVEYRMRSGATSKDKAGGLWWIHQGVGSDIIAYRVISEKPAASDLVNHPAHYTAGGVECIDALAAATHDLTGIEAVCTANAIKYLWRWKAKGGHEDLRKARWYINRLLGE